LLVACNHTLGVERDDGGNEMSNVGHGGTSSVPPSGAAGRAGAASTAAAGTNSCSGMKGGECQNGDCCTSLLVTGGTFEQGDPDAFSSTVSSFLLDKYEVTVGRFRNFVAAYDAWRAAGNPLTGSGENPHVPGSGWSADFTSSLSASASSLISDAAVDCADPTYQTWASSGNDDLPINCVDWFTSFAFCIWDGKRLPTEAEWEYAAARGVNNTAYPWGDVPIPDNSLATANLAAYDCLGDGNPDCSFADILPVGSRPDGNGLFGHSDLAGSMWEWDLDWFAPYPSSAQTDYANLQTGSTRVIRGGDFASPASTLIAGGRYSYGFPTAHFTNVGFRCAQNP
jgi:formylglycine-generating enzyme required for sulfatase activity